MLSSLRKKIIIAGLALGLLLVPVAVPVSVYAQDPPAEEETETGDANIAGSLGCGSALKTEGEDCSTNVEEGSARVQEIVTTIVNIFSIVVGIVAVIMIIFGGFKYITSGGDSGNITGAKNTIVYAVIGLVIVALAQFVVQFVLNRVSPPAA